MSKVFGLVAFSLFLGLGIIALKTYFQNPDTENKIQKQFSLVRDCGVIPKVKLRHTSRDAGLTAYGQIPWQAGIFNVRENAFICSGTLISKNLVVTSPFCILQEISDLEIRLGDWNIFSDSSQEIYEHFSTSILDLEMHATDLAQGGPEIAILKLKTEVDFQSYPQIAPICILEDDVKMKNEETNFVSGWGSSNRKNQADDEQKNTFSSIRVPILKSEDGSATVSQYRAVEHSKIKTNTELKIPDPIEDYIAELIFADSKSSSERHRQILDNTPTANSYLFPYNQNNQKIHEENLPGSKSKHLAKLGSDKRTRRNRKVLYSSHIEPEKQTILKLFQVEIHKRCFQSQHSENSHCISSSHGHFELFPCMIDAGSPVFCTRSNSQFPSPFPEEMISKTNSKMFREFHPVAYLTGIVVAWTPSCSSVEGQHRIHNSVPVLTFSQDTLKFLQNLVSHHSK